MLIKLCICFGICLSSKWFHLRLTFFLFSNLGLMMAQQTSIPVNCFLAGGWHTLCLPISKVHIVGEGPGAIPLVLMCLSYLINSFLTDIKQLAKTSKGGTLRPPSDVCVRSFLCPFSYLNKTLLHKSSWVIKPGPEATIFFFGDHESDIIHRKLSLVSVFLDAPQIISEDDLELWTTGLADL